MKKFVFSLETLRKLKLNTEADLKNQLSDINGKIMLTERQIADLDEEYRNESAKHQKELKEGTSAQLVQAYEYYFERYNKLREDRIKYRETLFKQRTELQKALLQVINELKAYDKIYQKEFEEYRKELAAEESKELDNSMNFKIYTEINEILRNEEREIGKE